MKVLCNGKEKIYTITCSKCDSDLEYTEDDVFYTNEEKKGLIEKTITHLFKEDEHYTNIYMQEYRNIKCPVCGYIIKTPSYKNGLPNMETIRWEKKK